MLADPAGPAADLLAAVVARYALDDVASGEQLPARRYLAHGRTGQIAADDRVENPTGSLIVFMTELSTGAADGSAATSGNRAAVDGMLHGHRIGYQLRLLRAHPSQDKAGNPPAPATISTASTVLIRDAARLVDALHAWAAALPPHLIVTLGAVAADGPSGKLAGNRVTVTLGPL